MTPNPQQQLDAVLAKLAALPTPPTGDDLRRWVSTYPDQQHAIIEFVSDWVEMECLRPDTPPTQEEVDRVVNLTLSQVQRLLDEEPQPDPIVDLVVAIRATGYDLEAFQSKIGIDRSILTGLAERLVTPASIPARIVTEIANALNRTVTAVRAFFLMPLQSPAVAYKAKGRPQPKQVAFQLFVEHSELSEGEKAQWLSEPIDPELGD